MAGPADITVGGYTTNDPGRFILSGDKFHTVTDASTSAGGPGEAAGATDLLLGALLTCALNVVSGAVEPALAERRNVAGSARLYRDENSSGLGTITLTLTVHGISDSEAADLAALYTQECSIYRALIATTRIDVVVKARRNVDLARLEPK
ncbi:OsmC family protein [Rhodococcus sp. BP-252]|uniref:hypothetical protein n=1 Tax=unclassified Rhodococcus (in: high G+C Gram-positive bacteria) TaxID=192944 RepID=UPI001C9B84AA|nr:MULTISPECIES: hypothetical protein [unclassified Rhodococcus (in: high G+C Gram-positive bacteria)]MBY6414520.1 OsmC family protein [Rhodococcus sp. BP-320]MBY6419571.1 OsmC family protein [Rhodococcus sp. BP-321]MBY6424187.1 OsmC family protein [Rhodococcus sp. BP-324]MBY6429522.1 OsmC family protein [Rhodococcus sp. BP-323]MBY6434413.1 OsmC family protein [Rhodococcus sp. BP-322]